MEFGQPPSVVGADQIQEAGGQQQLSMTIKRS
jgi:hypothetical protein